MPKRSLEALPSELHLVIFKELFQKTVISFGDTLEKQHEPLVILLTCRASYNIALPMLKRSITLHFASTGLMLQVLLPMSPEDRGQFRHMCVRGHAAVIDVAVCTLDTALCMLSGLHLDTLLVEEVPETRDEVAKIVESDGWRQLIYYMPTPSLLGHRDVYASPPTNWQQRIRGGDFYGSVSLFRGIRDDSGMAAGPHRYNASEMISLDDWEPYVKLKDSSASHDAGGRDESLTEVEMNRPLLLFAKRTGAYRQTGEHLSEFLRELIDDFGGDWSRIRAEWVLRRLAALQRGLLG